MVIHYSGRFINIFISEMSVVGLNESQNYIWNTKCDADCLGEGTFGKVYRGVHKRTGDKVAVKIFKQVSQSISQEYKMLQTLKHQYIIQMLGIEHEEFSKNIVMIMELCNGGSLMDFLNEPENTSGVEDSEFLLVFAHLSGGLEYLKKHNVIHRDVKPDNIMRHVMDDGRIVYKLADFGTARELPEGQNFYSLHGTEAYLNPQMFKVGFFPHAEFTREFGSNTDLWSIGVTLYQTATGCLPFMVQDRHVMLTIFDEMRHTEGIISGVQQKNSDQVLYQKKLPQSSRLSFSLKQLITPIIAGLFIQDKMKQWSFTQYYEQVRELISRKVINVFHINGMQMLKIYVRPDQTFADFKYYIYEQSRVNEENQVFLYQRNLIVDNFEIQTVDECVFLFDRTSVSVEPHSNIQLFFDDLSNFPTKFMSGGDNIQDLRLAFTASRDLCNFKNVMDYQSVAYKYFSEFIKQFGSYCLDERRELQKTYDLLLEKSSDSEGRARILDKLKVLNNSNEEVEIEFESKTDSFVSQCSKFFNDLNEVKTAIGLNTSHDSYLRIVKKELSDIKTLRSRLCSGKFDRKLYDYEKIKIVHCVRTIMEIFTDKADPSFDSFVDDMKKWYKKEFFAQVRTLSTLRKLIHKYRCDLKKYDDEVCCKSNSNLSGISTTKGSFPNKQQLRVLLEKYKENNKDLESILEENKKLVDKMSELIQGLEVDVTDL